MSSRGTSAVAEVPASPPTVGRLFLAFLVIGATSFGGGVVAYLRTGLVRQQRWVDDRTFVELLSISQSLPGLNATNMAMLVGDRLAGAWGALAAIVGISLPSAVLMYFAGVVYHAHGDRPLSQAMLAGVAAAAVGLVLATVVQLGRRSLSSVADLVFVALTVVAVDVLHQSVPRALFAVGTLAILWYRPRPQRRDHA
jgi:chromate transporter